MRAISLHQPWTSLLVTRQPTKLGHPGDCIGCVTPPMVKRFETRSWPCPPKLIGQRIAFHATKKRPRDVWRHVSDDREFPPTLAPFYDYDRYVDIEESGDGEHWRYRWAGPLGAIVGSGVIAASLPIEDLSDPDTTTLDVGEVIYRHTSEHPDPADFLLRCNRWEVPTVDEHIEHQAPYGDFTPGHYAWLIGDAAPTTERCPWCDGAGDVGRPSDETDNGVAFDRDCPVCAGTGRCAPIPAKGHQRIWYWEPS